MLIYDLTVFPVDHAMTVEEAIAQVDRLAGGWQIGLGRDHRLDAFIGHVQERWPELRGERENERPFEFDVMRHHVFVGIPPEAVERVLPAIAEAAWSSGVAVLDPQRQVVGLPAPFAEGPLGTDGVAEVIAATEAEEKADEAADTPS